MADHINSKVVNDKRLRVTELDFDNIKTNLKTFLKSQEEFKDYDFEGAGINILLDTLAYNTHYLAMNANMLANEMFLDSASLRSSVVSHAKSLGYETTSARAPVATVDVKLITPESSKTLSSGTAFSTSLDGSSYQYVTISDVTATNVGGEIIFPGVKLYEGTYITTRYTVDSSDVDQRFLLQDTRADASTLTVKVQTSSTDTTTTTYTKATDITQLTEESNVYFLQETDSGFYQVYFGDGVVSRGLSNGNIVILEYVVTNKSVSNGASSFSPPASIDGVTNVVVTTTAASTGGSEPESITSIKLNAPLDYASQGRCVTPNDYKVYVRKLFANTQAVSVWGGEDGSFDSSTGVSSNPEYGKVFISVKTTTGQNLTATQKSNLVAALSPYKVASVTPVIVDPDVTTLILNTTFNYDSTATTKTKEELASLVRTTINAYNTTSLQQFNSSFRHSRMTGLIDDTDRSILSNTTVVSMAKLIRPVSPVASASYTINFNNRIYNPHPSHQAMQGGVIASTGFYLDNDTSTEYFFDDDGNGNLRIYSLVGSQGTRIYYSSTAGTVNYATGVITVGSVYISGVGLVDGSTSLDIRIVAVPDSYDIVPVRNQILEIDTANTVVNSRVDAEATTGLGYTVTSTGVTTTTSIDTTPVYTPTTAY